MSAGEFIENDKKVALFLIEKELKKIQSQNFFLFSGPAIHF